MPPDGPGSAALPQSYFESEDHRFRLYQGDCMALMPLMPEATFDLVFADPPYFLSNGGITCHAGRMVSVNKGKWDRSLGFQGNYDFTRTWLAACQRLMKPNASIWVSGTSHIIHIVGCAMDELGFKILNDITWVKPNPPPNLSCRYFTHATETLLWAGRDKKTKHTFNYPLMKYLNKNKQMTSVWTIDAPRKEEKVFGKHPTQKPVALLERILAASSHESDLVFDPFAGSATTGVAAARMQRGFVGMEQEAQHLDVAAQRFVGVPQADSPDRILATVLAYRTAAPPGEELAVLLRVTVRQVQYCRQAAGLLGLLRQEDGEWRVTSRGETLNAVDNEDARPRLARIILAHPLVLMVRRLVRRCRKGEDVRPAVARLLGGCTVLGEGTCARRAQTILSWLDWADARLAGQRDLYGDVTPTPEEADDAAVA